MILNLSELSAEPLHAQISRQIRAKILSEDLAVGAGLPSIRALARQQRVSVITVKRAYDDLEKEGLVWSRPGKGFWVSELSAERRRDIVEERFVNELSVLVAHTAAEGLSGAAMRRILAELLEKGANR